MNVLMSAVAVSSQAHNNDTFVKSIQILRNDYGVPRTQNSDDALRGTKINHYWPMGRTGETPSTEQLLNGSSDASTWVYGAFMLLATVILITCSALMWIRRSHMLTDNTPSNTSQSIFQRLSIPAFGGRRRTTNLSTIAELTETEQALQSRNVSLNLSIHQPYNTIRMQKELTAPSIHGANFV